MKTVDFYRHASTAGLVGEAMALTNAIKAVSQLTREQALPLLKEWRRQAAKRAVREMRVRQPKR